MIRNESIYEQKARMENTWIKFQATSWYLKQNEDSPIVEVWDVIAMNEWGSIYVAIAEDQAHAERMAAIFAFQSSQGRFILDERFMFYCNDYGTLGHEFAAGGLEYEYADEESYYAAIGK
jgi:hypothetical protein